MKLSKSTTGLVVFALYFCAIFFFRLSMGSIFGGDHTGLVLKQNFVPFGKSFEDFGNMYRPLNVFVGCLFTHVYRMSESLLLFSTILAGLNAVLAFLIFQLAFLVCSSLSAALIATVLFLFSVPSISATWTQLFGNTQLFCLISITGSFIAYIKYLNTRKYLWLALLGVGLLVSPWFRQYGAIVSMTMFATELFRSPKNKALLFLSVFGLVHAFDQSLILVLTGVLPQRVGSIFSNGEVNRGLSGVNWTSTGRLFINFAPIGWLALIFSLVKFDLAKNCPSSRERKALTALLIVVFIVSLLFLRSPFFHRRIFVGLGFLTMLGMLTLVAGVTFRFSSLKERKLLALWMMLSLLPILKGYGIHEMHLVYATLPLFLIAGHNLSRWLERSAFSVRWRAAGAVFFVALPVADQLLNYFNAYDNQLRLVETHKEMGREVGTSVAGDHDILFCNFYSCVELTDYKSAKVPIWINEPSPISHHPDFPAHISPAVQLNDIETSSRSGGEAYYLLMTADDGSHEALPVQTSKVKDFEISLTNYQLDPLRSIVGSKAFFRYTGYTDWLSMYAHVDSTSWLGLKLTTNVKWSLFKVEMDGQKARML